jgi:glutathione S-transferase
MTLIVHGAPYSTCTQRILTTLEELNVTDYKLEFVDLSKGAHKSPDFLKLQPFGQVPVLQDGDIAIFESRAIVRYLSEKYAGQGTLLLGKTVKDKALVSQWLEVESQNYNPAASQIVLEKVFKPMMGAPCDEVAVAALTPKLEKTLDVYEAHLAKSKFLAGDFFSLADLSHLPYTNMLMYAAGKGDLITSRPHVSAWWSAISQRPSFQKVLAMAKR